jgi:hypothetical protein
MRAHNVFLFILLYLQFMSWHDLAVLCGNEQVTQRRQQSRVFPLVVCCATLTVAGSNNDSIENCLVSSVSEHERERTVKTMCQITTLFH